MRALRNFLLAPEELGLEDRHDAPYSVALLCSADVAWMMGSVLAGSIERANGWPRLVLLWGNGLSAPLHGFPALRSARRLVEKLRNEELDAMATGRLVRLDMPESPREVERTVELLGDLCDVPTITVLSGPRDVAIDRVINRNDIVYFIENESRALSQYVQLSLSDLRPPVERLKYTPGFVASFLARRGLFWGVGSGPHLKVERRGQAAIEELS